MKQLIVFILITISATACKTGVPVKSLCIFEFDPAQNICMCWTNKSKGLGVTCEQMNGYFALNKEDLNLIVDKLNKCKENGCNLNQ